ncbi:isoprenylcysteine carboxylmethyltransferase family protein [Sphingosinicella sp.]|uniref:methyltransferase family protein n=1 Tax=Sphingosinicella sp. TaxID=1917971 RepID=UPI0017B503A1|nr:isoprenylcysteine carboxylmethyltransferase family protein [Sphingosinicella sp.]MBA4756861.1 isoprenylcysteine carboxylmethyltransferase family protein [Sphingosinicella sp.]
MKIEEDSPQVRFPPPLVYAGMLLLGLGIGRLLDDPPIGLDIKVASFAGMILAIAGLGLIFAALLRFRRAGTNPEPWRQTTAFVASGVYRWTRNPMYLGMALIFAGLALIFDSLATLLLLPFVVILIDRQVIAREERYLEAKFGDDYRAYKDKVRRWL